MEHKRPFFRDTTKEGPYQSTYRGKALNRTITRNALFRASAEKGQSAEYCSFIVADRSQSLLPLLWFQLANLLLLPALILPLLLYNPSTS
jgi:hypothetical protein